MLAFISNLVFLFAETTSTAANPDSAWGRFVQWWDTYLNYPGFEAWRFFNLGVFLLVVAYLLKKPLSNAFKAKREAIRADLIKAEEERQAAITELTDAEAQLARLDAEKAQVIEDAKTEAAAEKARIEEEAANDISRMRGQADNEIRRKQQQAKAQLRRYSAEESIRKAEEKIRQAMDAQKDGELVKANIQSIGGAN